MVGDLPNRTWGGKRAGRAHGLVVFGQGVTVPETGKVGCREGVWDHGFNGGNFWSSDGFNQSRPVEVWVYPLLFLTGAVAGWVDAIAGGGGLLTVPALLWAGLPVPMALGTNKLQSSCGTAIATWRYARAGLLDQPALKVGIIATLVGASWGVASVNRIDPHLLKQVLPVLLVLVAGYFWLKPDLGDRPRPARLKPLTFAVIAGTGLGFYDGAFGPGTGSFWMAASVGLLGLDLRRATGWTKAMNLSSNLASLAVFLWLGNVHFTLGAVMAVGQVMGARVGSGMVLTRGRQVIRPTLLVVVLILATKLTFDALTHP